MEQVALDQVAFDKLTNKVSTEASTAIKNAVAGLTLDNIKGVKEKLGKYAEKSEFDNKITSTEQRIAALQASLDQQGMTLQGMQETGGQPEALTLKSMLYDRMEDFQKLETQGSGEIVMSLKTASIMRTDNTTTSLEVPEGFLDNFGIDSFVRKRRPREFVFDLASRKTVPSIERFKIWTEEGDEKGAFALVAEGGVKPLVSVNTFQGTAVYKKVAGKYVITEEFAKFRPKLLEITKSLINDKLLRDYETILSLDLLAKAAPYVGTSLDGKYEKPTDFHAIGAVSAQIEALNFLPNLLILNPQDKWRIGLDQDNMGQFRQNIPSYNPAGETILLGFTVRTSNKIPAGTFILGESGLWNIEDEAITIRVGHGVSVEKGEDGNVKNVTADIDTNRMRVIVETFFHSWIPKAFLGSFVKAEFNTVKEALIKKQ